ncbi:DUF7344 domain-containing protein [Halosolutus gelatinilyticus]|uniref:DUF7344 domain-containing protein n=1 Tax=Halosolutus gelatinilyticus TaxID=2931975 RepID=UPI001FF33F53|nr:hypothetical protein [Halosolutus gelatinilyticus]
MLAILADADRTLTAQDLAKELATRERERPITDVSGDLVTEIYGLLHHVHLPALAAANVVDYDHERGRVERTGETPELDAIVAACMQLEPASPS